MLAKLRPLLDFISKHAFKIVIFAVGYYIVVFSVYSILLQEIFYTQAFDSGIDDQGIWLLSRFMTPFVTVRGLNLFADSITLYHIFIAPFFWIWDNINILYIIQTVFIALGAIPLFLFAKDRLKSSFLALSVSLSFLLYPALQNLNLDQYHSEAIAVFFVILTIYFLLKNNFKLFYTFLIISFLGKDEIALTGFFIGLFLLLFKREFRHGLITMGLSVAWFLVCSRLLTPYFNGIGIFDPQPITYSHWFRGLTSNLFNWRFYWENFTHLESLTYYLKLLVPVAFIPVFAPSVLFIMIPSVAVNVLSGTGYLRSINYHYNYVQSAIMFFALIEGLYFLKQKVIKIKWVEQGKIAVLCLIVLVFAYAFNNLYSYLPINLHWFRIWQKADFMQSEETQNKKRAIRLIPKDAKVSASYTLVPHLSHRQEIYMFPNPFKENLWNQWFQEGKGLPPPEGHVDYVILDWSNHTGPGGEWTRKLISSPDFEKVYEQDKILLLKYKKGSRK